MALQDAFTHFMVAHGMVPNPAYVRYAFGRPPDKAIYFYFAGGLGDPLRLADGRDPVLSWRQLFSDDQPDLDAFLISLAGFPIAVATTPIRRNSSQMIDRIWAGRVANTTRIVPSCL
jgi:hypothetical protein